jgi:hypothetical protein
MSVDELSRSLSLSRLQTADDQRTYPMEHLIYANSKMMAFRLRKHGAKNNKAGFFSL